MSDLLSSHAWLGTDGHRVCIAIAAASPDEMIRSAAEALREHAFLELRLDLLPEPLLFPARLSDLLQQYPEAKLIATCRRKESGGGFAGSVEEELAILQAAADAGCAIVDLELETAETMRLEQHRVLRERLGETGTALLVSYHDYRGTRDLELNMARLLRHRPQIAKIVSTATALSDNLAILRLLAVRHGVFVVAIAMGEPGIVSRVLGPRGGSLFTFAASSVGAETAPGQPTAATLRDLYRIDQVHSTTRVYGVAGTLAAHSLSPLLHNTAFRTTCVDAVYLPLATDSVADLMRLVHELPVDGLSVTMPHKQAILPLLDRVDPVASRVGACNTVVRSAHDGLLYGYNTDVTGVTVPLEKRLSLKRARVLVEGAGGAARAAVFGLIEKGADVWILNRTAATAAALAAEAGARVAEPGMLADTSFDVFVNATPLGSAKPGRSAGTPSVEEPIPAALVFDMVYRPLETPLIQRARAEGRSVITGVEMFVHQGARQFELWTGQDAPEAEMLRVVLEALRQDDEPNEPEA